MRPELARSILALAAASSPLRDALVTATEYAAQHREPWWRWTCWLAVAIAVREIPRRAAAR